MDRRRGGAGIDTELYSRRTLCLLPAAGGGDGTVDHPGLADEAGV